MSLRLSTLELVGLGVEQLVETEHPFTSPSVEQMVEFLLLV